MYLFKLNRLINGQIVPRVVFDFYSTLSRAKANATIEAYKDLSVKSASIFYMHTTGEMELVACRIYVPFLGVKARNWFSPEKFIEVPEKPEEELDKIMKDNLLREFAKLGAMAAQMI